MKWYSSWYHLRVPQVWSFLDRTVKLQLSHWCSQCSESEFSESIVDCMEWFFWVTLLLHYVRERIFDILCTPIILAEILVCGRLHVCSNGCQGLSERKTFLKHKLLWFCSFDVICTIRFFECKDLENICFLIRQWFALFLQKYPFDRSGVVN